MFSIVDLVGTAGQSNFSFSFPYLSRDHIHMYLDGIETLDFTFNSTFVVTLDTPLVADATVRVRRLTPLDEPAVDFTNGSVLGEADLDAAALQTLYVVQEIDDIQTDVLRSNDAGDYDFHGQRGVNLADPVALQDAVTKRYADDQSGTAAQQAAVERAEDAAAEATADLVAILAIDLSNISEYMRTVLVAETPLAARDLLEALTGVGPVLENPKIEGTLGGNGGPFFIETPTLTGLVNGTYELLEPTVTTPTMTNPTITGTIAGTPEFSPNPTFGTPLAGTLTAGTPLVLDPYNQSVAPSQAHALGAIPTFLQWYLECLTADAGYSTGDRVTQALDIDNGITVRGFTVSMDATTCYIATSASNPFIRDKNAAGSSTINAAKWKLVVVPYRLN